jgi:hypothetical protein
MVKETSHPRSTLNSWKEIATFLNRGVRTVQRWERELGLPVYRVRKSEHSPVFAYARELKLWMESRSVPLDPSAPERRQAPRVDGRAGSAGGESTVQRSHRLMGQLAASVAEHRIRAEALVDNLNSTMAKVRERRKRP